MNGFFRDDEGHKSMGRLLAFLGLIIGALVSLGGVASIFIPGVNPAGGAVAIPSGCALAGAGEYFKMKAKKVENGG